MASRPELAARRKALGFSQESLAHALGVSSVTVARWEQGTHTPYAKHRGPLADILHLTMPQLAQMLVDDDGMAVALYGLAVPAWLGPYASLEQGATKLQTFESSLIPGLLQTEAYAAAVMRAHYRELLDESVVEQRVRARMARQAVLSRQPEPLELVCVIDESALHRLPSSSDSDVMTAQLHHLAATAELPTVQVRVVPARDGALHSAFGAFRLFTSAGTGSSPFMVCIEDLDGFNYKEKDAAIEEYLKLFEHLTASALSNAESTDLIRATAESNQ